MAISVSTVARAAAATRGFVRGNRTRHVASRAIQFAVHMEGGAIVHYQGFYYAIVSALTG